MLSDPPHTFHVTTWALITVRNLCSQIPLILSMLLLGHLIITVRNLCSQIPLRLSMLLLGHLIITVRNLCSQIPLTLSMLLLGHLIITVRNLCSQIQTNLRHLGQLDPVVLGVGTHDTRYHDLQTAVCTQSNIRSIYQGITILV